jgi:hypothetical protein
MAFGWKLVGTGSGKLPLGAVVRPDERLSWPKTIGVGAQHVVAMFGATFVFPLIMGLNATWRSWWPASPWPQSACSSTWSAAGWCGPCCRPWSAARWSC